MEDNLSYNSNIENNSLYLTEDINQDLILNKYFFLNQNYYYNFVYTSLFSEVNIQNNESSLNNKNNDSQNDNNKTDYSFSKKKENKRGRKKNKNKKFRREHDKSARDNIKRKIQVHYFKFLRNLINQIIDILYKNKNNIKYKFWPLNYNFTKKITKDSFYSLKNSKIGDIFKDNVSPKYKNFEKLNLEVYNEVTKNDIIKNILDKMYLEFFNKYYLNDNKINLSKYGLELSVNLSPNLGFYKNLINHEKECNDITYLNKIEKCIKNDFLGSPIFVVN